MKLTKTELLRARTYLAERCLREMTPSELMEDDIIHTLEKWKLMLSNANILHYEGDNLRAVLEKQLGERISNHDYRMWSEMFWVFSGKKVANT